MTWFEPQNPYASFLVAASAGSGKTYQLTHRYLSLVAAGALPKRILTVTFTKKAAAEMRARVLDEAARLEASGEAFDEKMRAYHSEAQKRLGPLPPPLCAKEVSACILTAPENLRLSTIDSLFWEWINRFGPEAGLAHGSRLIDELEAAEFDNRAWQQVAASLNDDTQRFALLQPFFAERGLFDVERQVTNLAAYDTYLWLSEKSGWPLLNYDIGRATAFWPLAADALQRLAQVVNPNVSEAILAALSGEDLAQLLSSRLLTQDGRVSGGLLRGKKREALADDIRTVEEELAAHLSHGRLRRLNAVGYVLYELYEEFQRRREELKRERGALEFSDLAKGCYRLFSEVAAAPARYAILRGTSHLLLDEFQDTSRLQWRIFQTLAEDLLQEAVGPTPATVFLVGDAKQSIYGFREADPGVMADAALALGPLGVGQIGLNTSYRSAPLVLDLVNAHFEQGGLQAFEPHRPAANTGIADVGAMVVAKVFCATEERSAAEAEAAFIADLLANRSAFAGASKDLEPSDCAVLYRSATHAEAYERALRARGVPVVREEQRGFFSRAEITDALALLTHLALPADLVALATVLKSPMGKLSDSTLLSLLATAQGASSPIERASLVFNALEQVAPELAASLARLRQSMGQVRPHAILAEAFAAFNALESYRQAFGESDGPLAADNLERFCDVVISLEEQGYRSPLGLVERLRALAALDNLGNASRSQNAVSLMTIHKAKGLEFTLVVLADAARKWEKRDLYWAKGKANDAQTGVFYTGIKDHQPSASTTFNAVTSALDQELEAESARLLYVALTRAKHHLVVTGNGRLSEESVHAQLAATAAALGAKPTEIGGIECLVLSKGGSLGNLSLLSL